MAGDYYQLLGITPAAAVAEIRQAYARLAKERHPDKFSDPAEKQKAQAFFQDLTTAYNTLTNESRRREYDAERERPKPQSAEEIARDAFQRSAPALESGDFQQAVTLLRTAVHHAPNDVQYQLALGRTLGRTRETAREAIQVLEKASQVAPGNATLWADIAALYQHQGLKLRAQKAIETALRINPRDARVARLAAELGVGRS